TRKWIDQAVKAETDRNQAVLPAFFSITTKDLVICRTYRGVRAINLKDGSTAWMSESVNALDRITQEPARNTAAQQWLQTAAQLGRLSLLYENANVGCLSTDNQRVYVVDDIQLPLPLPMANPFGGVPTPTPAALADALTGNRLQAIDLTTGKLLWELSGRTD